MKPRVIASFPREIQNDAYTATTVLLWCEFAGETIANVCPPTRYYPYRGSPKKRTKRKQMQHALKSIYKNEPVKGVKGSSVIGILPTFDPVRGVAVDYMHCVCLGVMRQFVNMWMDTKNSDQPYYIGRCEDEINDRLLAIKSPLVRSAVHQGPFQIAHTGRHQNGEPLYSTALLFLMACCLQCFSSISSCSCMVYTVYCLLGDSICESTINSAEVSLTKFVILTEDIGLKRCTFNVHQLVHLAQSVRDCGPLWSSSTFLFESNNH